MTPLAGLQLRLQEQLSLLYGEARAADLADQLIAVMDFAPDLVEPLQRQNKWDQGDVMMITYADSIRRRGEKPLRTLRQFCSDHLGDCISWLHILPFYPYTSDDGFAVSDYDAVNPEHGDWHDIEAISADFRLMVDMVINHCSSSHHWFEAFSRNQPPYDNYFVQASPYDDLSQVVRPRTSPLLQAVNTPEGLKHVWCTFSHDQVDLNFANPEVLVEVARILKLYMQHGATIFRLDAIAFLWKEADSNCINLPQTHAIIRLLRLLAEYRHPDAVIITETNIPNRENLSYFGNANEAHLIYNFSFPPLLLHAMLTGNCCYLQHWMMSMPPARNGTTYLNFIASHDGIGLRPAEGLLSDEEIDQVAAAMRSFGGLVSSRTVNQQQSRPYEINIAFYDAMKGTLSGEDGYQFERFICAHAIMLALEGVPSFYVHSLFATCNDTERVEQTGSNRAINRHSWDLEMLEAALQDKQSHHARVFVALQRLIALRAEQNAFHPNATQFTMHLGQALFAFWRQSMDREQSIFCINNITDREQVIPLSALNLIVTDEWRDLISGRHYDEHYGDLVLAPYQTVWISNATDQTAA
ncbi:sugar phosphorylase [Mariprofundus ferrooxydans]|uniref:Glycosidase n=1 Tax=Mariprofundus ferrooxydans PV-1 TaxID=314345 RepID=Q0EWT3_9PROT|nr:sugar phosphorylase [Mariprofundus ferrooxydans]EAU53706.1 Glycosidase [Mariprofundus ferrooxydans PV-1]KON48531.1 alpha-amylase [Mariprofundus ferrooxydans]